MFLLNKISPGTNSKSLLNFKGLFFLMMMALNDCIEVIFYRGFKVQQSLKQIREQIVYFNSKRDATTRRQRHVFRNATEDNSMAASPMQPALHFVRKTHCINEQLCFTLDGYLSPFKDLIKYIIYMLTHVTYYCVIVWFYTLNCFWKLHLKT